MNPSSENNLKALRWCFSCYVFLLIFEGALRKWIMPEAANSLLLVRDPLAVIIYILAATKLRNTRFYGWLTTIYVLCLITVVLALVQLVMISNGFSQVLIAVYGVRTYWLHFPLAFVFANVVTLPYMRKMLNWLCLTGAAMGALMVLQYLDSSDSFLNRGAGGVEDVMIGAANGRIRPAGTFAYATGPSTFFPIVLAAGLLGIYGKRYVNKTCAAIGLVSALAVVPISGSRTLMMGEACVLLAALPLLIFDRRFWVNIMVFSVLAFASLSVVVLTETGRLAMESFTERWTDAAEVESGEGGGQMVLFIRVWDIIGGGLSAANEVGFIGKGVGLGTNVGAYMSSGSVSFLLAEYEWARIILECGPIFGLVIILWRCWTCFFVFERAVRLRGKRRLFVIVTMGAMVPNMLFGHTQQATVLGCVVLSLMMAMGVLELETQEEEQASFSGSRRPRHLPRTPMPQLLPPRGGLPGPRPRPVGSPTG